VERTTHAVWLRAVDALFESEETGAPEPTTVIEDTAGNLVVSGAGQSSGPP